MNLLLFFTGDEHKGVWLGAERKQYQQTFPHDWVYFISDQDGYVNVKITYYSWTAWSGTAQQQDVQTKPDKTIC